MHRDCVSRKLYQCQGILIEKIFSGFHGLPSLSRGGSEVLINELTLLLQCHNHTIFSNKFDIEGRVIGECNGRNPWLRTLLLRCNDYKLYFMLDEMPLAQFYQDYLKI